MLACLCAWAPACVLADGITVTVRAREAGGFELLRDGKPYYIQGAGGQTRLDLAADCGANSIRLWNADDQTEQVLDEAQRRGMTVALGLWMGHARHGFNYGDEKQLAAQKEKFRQAVLKFKDHPALLVWGIGNEMELDSKGRDDRVWMAVEDLAKMVKQMDPNHPTMAVIAEIGGPKVDQFRKYCKDVDILGINSYDGLPTLSQRLTERGYTGPYVVTEFNKSIKGKTAWGAPIELTSSEKADVYLHDYQDHIRPDPRCLGSYAFKWGWKYEHTATMENLFLQSGEKLNGVDALAFCWTGHWPTNRCPQIEPITLDGKPQMTPGQAVQVHLAVKDLEGNPLTVQWELRAESIRYGVGGDRETEAPILWTRDGRPQGNLAFTAPEQAGGYRLFVYVRDGHGGAATANVPFYVGTLPTSQTAAAR